MQPFAKFMKVGEAAAIAYAKGNATEVNSFTCDGSAVTFSGPNGPRRKGKQL